MLNIFKRGDLVRFIDENKHKTYPQYYPELGTIGEAVYVRDASACDLRVQWPSGSTSGDDQWWVEVKCVELANNSRCIAVSLEEISNLLDL